MKALWRPLIGFGVFAAISLLATTSIWSTLAKPVGSQSHSFTAYFIDATGLRPGDDVRVAGVRAGRVTRVALDNDRAVVDFDLAADQQIFTNTHLAIRYQDLTGRRYLSVTLDRNDSQQSTLLDRGAAIDVDRTTASFDVTALLNGFSPLFATLEPSAVNALSSNIIAAFNGDAVSIPTLLAQATALAKTVADSDDILGEIISNLTTVLGTIDRQRGRTEELLVAVPQLVDQVDHHSEQIGQSVNAIGSMAGSLADTLRTVRAGLTGTVANAVAFTSFINRDGHQLATALPQVSQLANLWSKSTGNGSYWNIYACNLDISLYGVLFPPDVIASIGGSQHSETCRR